jgi:hypothetical protein
MTCTACGSARVFPSRLRNIVERVRHGFTGREPYRCHQCGLRTWRDTRVHDDDHDTRPEDLRTGRSTAPVNPKEIDELDSA